MLNGLAISAVQYAVLDGNVEKSGYWWFSIGTNSYYKNNRIPGPFCNDSINSVTKTNDLWIKIKDMSILKLLPRNQNFA